MINIFTEQNLSQQILADIPKEGENLRFAVAFFSHIELIEELLEKGCQLKLIVRLEYPTNAESLYKLITGKYKNQIDIRCFINNTFHSKLYLFQNRKALIGSANLTHKALSKNDEILVEFNHEHEAELNTLHQLFENYWEKAEVLTENILRIYSENFLEIQENRKNESSIIKVKQPSKTKKKFQSTYEENVKHINQIISIFAEQGRFLTDTKLPLRLEVDCFIHYVKETKMAQSNEMADSFSQNIPKLKQHIKEWKQELKNENSQFLQHLRQRCTRDYPMFMKTLGSPTAIATSSFYDLAETLLSLNTFWQSARYVAGGREQLQKRWEEDYSTEFIRNSLNYLLYGQDDLITRMIRLHTSKEYKLFRFGENGIQELIGWVNQENLPIINGRVIEVLKFYGFDVIDSES